jgi:hypothetical protein
LTFLENGQYRYLEYAIHYVDKKWARRAEIFANGMHGHSAAASRPDQPSRFARAR